MQLLPNPILIYDGATAYAPAVTSLSFTGGTLSPFPGGVQVAVGGGGGGGGVGPAVANQIAYFNGATSVIGSAAFTVNPVTGTIFHTTLSGGATVSGAGTNNFVQARATAGISHGITGQYSVILANYTTALGTDMAGAYSFVTHNQTGWNITDNTSYGFSSVTNTASGVVYVGTINSISLITANNTSTTRTNTTDSFTITKTNSNAVFNAGNNNYASNCFANFIIGGTNNTVTIGNNQLTNSFLNVRHDSASNADQLTLSGVSDSVATIVSSGVGTTNFTGLSRTYLASYKPGGSVAGSTIESSFVSLYSAGVAANVLSASSITGSFLRANNQHDNMTLQNIIDSVVVSRQAVTTGGQFTNYNDIQQSFISSNNSESATLSLVSVYFSSVQIANAATTTTAMANIQSSSIKSNIASNINTGTQIINVGTGAGGANVIGLDATIDLVPNTGGWLTNSISVDKGVNSNNKPSNVLFATGAGDPAGNNSQIIGRVRTAISYGDGNNINFDYTNDDPNGNRCWPGFLFGRGLITRAPYETVLGRWNTDIVYGAVITIDGTLPALRIGGGTSAAARTDVFRIDQDGKHQTFAAEKHKTRTSTTSPQSLSARTDYSLGFTNTGNKTINLPVYEDGLEYKVTCTVGSGTYTVDGGVTNIIHGGVSNLTHAIAVGLGGSLEIFAIGGVWICKYLA